MNYVNAEVVHLSKANIDPKPLKKEYVEKMKRIAKEKHIFIGTIEDLRKRYE